MKVLFCLLFSSSAIFFFLGFLHSRSTYIYTSQDKDGISKATHGRFVLPCVPVGRTIILFLSNPPPPLLQQVALPSRHTHCTGLCRSCFDTWRVCSAHWKPPQQLISTLTLGAALSEGAVRGVRGNCSLFRSSNNTPGCCCKILTGAPYRCRW